MQEKTYPSSAMVLHAVCPHCGNVAECLDHLLVNAAEKPYVFGPWQCYGCKQYYNGTLSTVDGEPSVITVKSDKSSSEKVYDLLVLPPQNKPVYLIVSKEDYGIRERDMTYYYNEGTCPTNWFKDVESIVYDQDGDPHGLFQFVGRNSVEDALSVLDEDGRPRGLEFLHSLHPELFN